MNKKLIFSFTNLTYIKETNENDTLLHNYFWPTLEKEVGYLINVKDKIKSLDDLKIFKDNKRMISILKKGFIDLFFKDYYSKLSYNIKELKDKNPSKITFYANLKDKFVKPINSESNYIAYDDNIYFNSIKIQKTLLPFIDDDEINITHNRGLLHFMLDDFPFMEIVINEDNYCCFNTLYSKRFSRKNIAVIPKEGKFFIDDDIDNSKPFSELITEYNYYFHYNILPVIEVNNVEVKIL